MKYLFSLLLVLMAASCSPPKDETLRAREVKQRALADVGLLKSDLSELHRLILVKNADTTKIQSAFKSARLHYKAVEYLAEYLVPRVAKRMNGPAKVRPIGIAPLDLSKERRYHEDSICI